ncbi:MAG: TlpA family protein disulfide reductase [Nitrospinae bacterium]|nr:TlpA family protein disulfide reductase [Nitrospinota bacterium]
MQNTRTFKEQSRAALAPFAVLCVALLAVYAYTIAEITSRPQPAPAEAPAPSAKAEREPPPSPMEGKEAPDFDLPTLGGKRVRLADLKGKVLFINIWATWCLPCREEMPSMEKLYGMLKGPDFEMIGISVDKDPEKSVAPFVKELGLTFPILLDPASETAAKYKITGVPETYLVAPNGIIIHHLVGPAKWDRPDVVEALKKLVEIGAKKNEDPKNTKKKAS